MKSKNLAVKGEKVDVYGNGKGGFKGGGLGGEGGLEQGRWGGGGGKVEKIRLDTAENTRGGLIRQISRGMKRAILWGAEEKKKRHDQIE